MRFWPKIGITVAAFASLNAMMSRVLRTAQQSAEVGRKVGLEFVVEDSAFRCTHAFGLQHDVVNDDSALCFDDSDTRRQNFLDRRMAPGTIVRSNDADAFALESIRGRLLVKSVAAPAKSAVEDRRRRRPSLPRAEWPRRERSSHRTGGVLTMRYRNDAAAANQAQAWFDADHTVRAGWTNHGAIGFRADSDRRQIGGNRDRRAAG